MCGATQLYSLQEISEMRRVSDPVAETLAAVVTLQHSASAALPLSSLSFEQREAGRVPVEEAVVTGSISDRSQTLLSCHPEGWGWGGD